MAEFRRVSTSTIRSGETQKALSKQGFNRFATDSTRDNNIFSKTDLRNKSEIQNSLSQIDKSKRDLNSNDYTAKTKAAARLAKIAAELNKTAEKELDSLVSLTTELEKLDKDLKSAGNPKVKADAIRRKRQILVASIQSFNDYSGKFIERLAAGGMDPEIFEEYKNLYKKLATESGKNADVAAAEFDTFANQAKQLLDSGQNIGFVTHRLGEEIGKLTKTVQDVANNLDQIVPGLSDSEKLLLKQAQQLEEAKALVVENFEQLKKDGKTLTAALYKFRELRKLGLPAGGALAEGAAESSVLDVLTGGKSKGLSKYAGKDGGLNNAEIYKTLLSGMGDAAKAGFEAYRNSRQYGTMGMGFGDVYGTYQAHKREVAKVALTTGVSEEQANAAYGGVAANLRVGTADPKARYQQMVDLTKQTIQLANATGLSEDRVTKLATAYRRNFSGGPMKAMKETTEGIAGALQNINSQVGDDFKLTSEDVADVWDRLAGDIENSGLDMKKLMSYSQGTAIAFGQMGINTNKTLEMMKRVEDFKLGKGGAAAGESEAAMFALMGKVPTLGANAFSMMGGTKNILSATSNMNEEDFTKYLTQKSKGTPAQEFFTGFNQLAISDTDYKIVLRSLMSGMDASEAIAEVGGNAGHYMELVRKIFGLPNSDKVLGTTIEQWDKEVLARLDKMSPGASRVFRKSMGMTGAGEAQRRAAAKSDEIRAKGRAEGKSPEQIEQEVKAASSTNAKLAAAADPMGAFSKAVNVFSGSVNTFAALTAAKGLFDLFKMRGGLPGMPGGGGGLPGLPGGGVPGPSGGMGLGSVLNWATGGASAVPGATAGSMAAGAVNTLGPLAIAGKAIYDVASDATSSDKATHDKFWNADFKEDSLSNDLGMDSNSYSGQNLDEIEKLSEEINSNKYGWGSNLWRRAKIGWKSSGGLLYSGLKDAGRYAVQGIDSALEATGAYDPKKPDQAKGVQPQTTTVNVNAQGGTAYYDAARGGTVAPLEIFTPAGVSSQANREGERARN